MSSLLGKSSAKVYSQLPKGSGTFEIDVNTNEGRRTLEYMSYLLNYHFGNTFYTISFLVKSADGSLSDGLGDFLITRNGIFKVGRLYSPQISEASKDKFAEMYKTDLIQMRYIIKEMYYLLFK